MKVIDDTPDLLLHDKYTDDKMNYLLKELDQCQAQFGNDITDNQDNPPPATNNGIHTPDNEYNGELDENNYSAITERIDRFLESQTTFTKDLSRSSSAVQDRSRDIDEPSLGADDTLLGDLVYPNEKDCKIDKYLPEDDLQDDLDDFDGSDADEEELSDRRCATLRELLTTERSYVKSLKRLCECFLYPMRSMSQQRKGLIRNVRHSLRAVRVSLIRSDRKSLFLNHSTSGSGQSVGGIGGAPGGDPTITYSGLPISESDIRVIFSNIETILSVHKRALRLMEERHRQWSKDSSISDIFKLLIPTLPMYRSYVENFTNATATLERLSSQSSQFAKFINQGDQGSIDSMNLKAYLSLPIRRVTRYATYMMHQSDLLPSSHPSYGESQVVFKQFTHLMESVSESVFEMENRLRLKSLERAISGLPSQISHIPRRIIHLGTLQQFTLVESDPTMESRFVILLDDRIIWTRESQADRYVFKDQIMLAGAFVTDLADTGLYENAFRVVGSSGKEVLLCSEAGEADKRDWVAYIQTALNPPAGGIGGFDAPLYHLSTDCS